MNIDLLLKMYERQQLETTFSWRSEEEIKIE